MNQEYLFGTIYQTGPDFYVQCRNVETDVLFAHSLINTRYDRS